MSYICICKDNGPLVPVRIGIVENGVLQGTVCFKQWCPACKNSRLNNAGEVLYYQIKGGGEFEFNPMNFWAPETVPFQAKRQFVDTVLKMGTERRYEGDIYFTMEQVRDFYRGK